MSRLQLSKELTLPLSFLEHRKVVLGGSGTGKTAGGRVVFEEATKAGVVCGAVDLKGDWWGLKSRADGKAEGIPVVIFGGDHQDVPLDEAGGTATADIVVDLRQPFILDLENFSKGKQLRFIAAFAERLYDRNRKPLVMFWDEIDRYAPQKPMSPEANICLGAMEDIAKRGRKHGIFSTFITQRNAGLNKGVSELCDVAMVFRTPGPRDQEAVRDWFDTNATKDQRDAVMANLASLATGTAIICCAHPTLRLFTTVPIRLPETFDSSATPAIGGRLIVPKKLAAPDLQQLQEKMAATIEKARAADPKELRAKIHHLEAENRKLKVQPISKVQVKIKEVPVLKKGEITSLTKIAQKLCQHSKAMRDDRAQWLEISARLTACFQSILPQKQSAHQFEQIPAIGRAHMAMKTESMPGTTTQKLSPTKLVKPHGEAHVGSMPAGERKILTVLAQYPDGRSKVQVAILAGYAHHGGGFNNYIGAMRVRGWIEGSAESLRILQPGLEALGAFNPLPAGEDLLNHWIRQLGKCEALILNHLYSIYPGTLTKENLAATVGYEPNGGGFNNALGKLRTLELICGRGELKASGVFFE